MRNRFGRDTVMFVLQARANGLGVIRSLGREGIPVVAADPLPEAPGLHSRFCRRLIVPDPEIETEMALKLLLQEGEKLKEKGILFPSSDAFVIFISKHRQELSEHFKMTLPQGNMAGELVSKQYQYAEALKVGMDMPSSYYPSTLEELEAIKDSIHYPALIKPYLSYVFVSRFNRKGFVANSPQELVSIFKQLLPSNLQVMVESFVPGPVTNLFEMEAYVGQRGMILASLIRQKLRQLPEDFGLGTLFRTVHNEEVRMLGSKFLESIKYKGIANIEFKLDDSDGKYKMIEINLRSSLPNFQATHAGVNLPLIQYLDLTNQPLPPQPDYEDGVTWLDTSRDILAYRSLKNRASPMAFIQSWLGANCYAYYSWDDPVPAIARFSSLKGMMSEALTGLTR